jgi:hypothetical protein
VPPEYISAGLPGLGGCSLICNDDGAGDWTTKTYTSDKGERRAQDTQTRTPETQKWSGGEKEKNFKLKLQKGKKRRDFFVAKCGAMVTEEEGGGGKLN